MAASLVEFYLEPKTIFCIVSLSLFVVVCCGTRTRAPDLGPAESSLSLGGASRHNYDRKQHQAVPPEHRDSGEIDSLQVTQKCSHS